MKMDCFVIWFALLTCTLVHSCSGLTASDFPRCTDTSLENPGYSYTQRHGRALWTHCGFPNPKLYQVRCSRTNNPEVTYDLCDPDVIIPGDAKANLDQSLWTVEKKTPYQCTPWHGAVLNYTILLVAVRYLRIPDLSSNETCVNSCGEIVPDLDEATRSATDEEKQLVIDNFATGLVHEFQSYFCDTFLVIAYWENETLISTAQTDGTAKHISTHTVDVITKTALEYLNANDIEGAFNAMINEYRKKILGFTPAYILLVSHILLVVLTGLLIVIYILFGGKSDYYDDEKWKVAMKTFMKILFGIWFIELLLITLVRVQDKIRPWVLIVPLLFLIAAIAASVLLYQIEQKKAESSSA